MPAPPHGPQKPLAIFSARRWHGPPHAHPSQLQAPKQLATQQPPSPHAPPWPNIRPLGRAALRKSDGRGARREVATWQASPHASPQFGPPNNPVETQPVADRHRSAANAMHCFIENPPVSRSAGARQPAVGSSQSNEPWGGASALQARLESHCPVQLVSAAQSGEFSKREAVSYKLLAISQILDAAMIYWLTANG